MGEERIRGEGAAGDRDATAPSGWVTTQVAAKSLGISPRTVRWHIEQGNLEATLEGEGVRRSWLVSIDSLQAFRGTRQRQGQSLGDYRAPPESAGIAAESSGNAIRELADRLVEEAAKASEFRVRLELSERAESTLREELADERRRREEAERERDDLRRQLYARREPQESPETVDGASEGVESMSYGVEDVHESTQESTDAPEMVEEAPEEKEPRPATGAAQGVAEGLSGVEPSLVWHRVAVATLSVLPVIIDQLLLDRLWPDTRSNLTAAFGSLLLLCWIVFPAVLSFRLGRKVRKLRFWHNVAPGVALLALGILITVMVSGIVYEGARLTGGKVVFFGFGGFVFAVPPSFTYSFAAILGNALRRRQREKLIEEKPSEFPPEAESASQGWSPRQQAIVGLAGTVISALIGLIGTIITVLANI